MIDDVIQKNRLTIKDDVILGIIKHLNIQYIRLLFDHDVDGKTILVANIPDNKKDLSFGKFWIKVNIKNGVYIMLPSYLKRYVGQKIQYRYEELFRGEFELFRIRPVDFNFKVDGGFENIRSTRPVYPYFTNSNNFVIPKMFISDNFDKDILTGRISFERTMHENIDNGVIYANIILPPMVEEFSYLLKNCLYDLRTKPISSFKKFVQLRNKRLADFKFTSIIRSNDGFDKTMLFTED